MSEILMPTGERRRTPEETELEKKRSELDKLESQLVERELELETLRGGLASFEKKYQAATIDRYAQLDELFARIAEAKAAQAPQDELAQFTAAAQRAKAEKTAAKVRSYYPPPQTPEEKEAAAKSRSKSSPRPPRELPSAPAFNPSESLKRLYRDVAKLIHPDLADSDTDREHRHAFMARANEAYESNNEAKLTQVLHDWHCSPESVRGEGAAAELIRSIRKIARCEQRLVDIGGEIQKLETAGIFGIRMLADEADKMERDFLEEMTRRIDEDIANARQYLEQLERNAPKTSPPETPSPGL